MPITHIKTTTVPVSDEATALDFYVNTLGFELRRDEPMGPMRWIEVAPPGGQTVIVLARGYGHDSTRLGTFTGLVLEADDIQATYEQLRDRGVTFSEGPTAQPWGGVQALFADQDGNGYVLVQTQSAPAASDATADSDADASAQPTEAH
jgi:catechol 2,3-dioxygenase-like lactoylglutathione lyase family enzyme